MYNISFDSPVCYKGDNVVVTMTITPEAAGAQLSLSYSSTNLSMIGWSGGLGNACINYNNATITINDYASSGSSIATYEFTFKALEEGSGFVEVSEIVEIVDENGDPQQVSVANQSLVTINQVPSASSEARLESLVIEPGSWDKEFNSDITEYSIYPDSQVNELSFQFVLKDSNATISYWPYSEPNKIQLDDSGTTSFTIRVTAQDGITFIDYNINIIQDKQESFDFDDDITINDRLLKGKELFYYTKKVKEAITSSKGEVDISGVYDAIDSAKEDINANIDSLDENYQNLTEVYNLLINKLDSMDDKLNLMFANVEEFKKSVPYKATAEEPIGYVSLINLLALTGHPNPNYGTACYCENLQESIEALREGRDLVISNNYSEVIYTSEEENVVDVDDQLEPVQDSGDNISTAWQSVTDEPIETVKGIVPEGLPIVEYYHTSYGDYFVSENLFITNEGGMVPQSQVDKYDELYSIIDQFENGEISFEEYMEQLNPYKHTMIIFSSNDSSGTIVKAGSNRGGQILLGKYIVLTDIPKNEFVEVEGEGQK